MYHAAQAATGAPSALSWNISDAFDFGCRVIEIGDGFEVTGVKALQTGGYLADVFLTYARDERNDLQLLLVERGDPGVTVEPVPTAGFNAAGLTRLTLDRVQLDACRQLVRVDGLSHAQMFLSQRRLLIACPMVGRMNAILEHCARHLGASSATGSRSPASRPCKPSSARCGSDTRPRGPFCTTL